jgi:hypothetical protein
MEEKELREKVLFMYTVITRTKHDKDATGIIETHNSYT